MAAEFAGELAARPASPGARRGSAAWSTWWSGDPVHRRQRPADHVHELVAPASRLTPHFVRMVEAAKPPVSAHHHRETPPRSCWPELCEAVRSHAPGSSHSLLPWTAAHRVLGPPEIFPHEAS